MPVNEEKCFPRGGKEHSEGKPKKSPKSSKRKRLTVTSTPVAIPEKHVESHEKLVAVRKKRDANSKQPEIQNSMKNLSLKSLSEGMIILGYIREVTSVELKVNLPGLVVGYIPAANVSEEYCKYWKELLSGNAKELQELTDMFKPGQLVVTCIEEISASKGKTKVTLSLVPGRVNKSVSFRDILEGLLLSASVQSIEDHVYVMNCGIHGVKASLKKDQAFSFENTWNNGKPLGVGQVLRCLVTKCVTSEGSAKVELTVDPDKLSEYFVEKSYVPVNSGIVGKCFQLSVQKIYPAGLLVKFANHQFGYVHSNHLNRDFSNMKENSLLPGRALYIDPSNNYIIFSALKSVCDPHPPSPPFQEFKKGSRFSEAKVITNKGGNLLVEFGENFNYYGLVSMHQLDISKYTRAEKTFYKVVQVEYPPDSYHECKVLEYDFMTEKYICSFKRSIIEQKYTSIDELYPGLVTTCKVKSFSDKKITLKLCDILGFVEPIQFSDVPDSHSHTLLKKGQKVKAKVLSVKNPICEFTLKSALVNSSNPVLTKFSDAKCGVQYEGVIVLINDRGVLVKFYADFRTFVLKKHVFGGSDWDLNEIYHVGQVVNCNVLKIYGEEQKLILSVQPLKSKQSKKERSSMFPLKIGKLYTVTVRTITDDGLIVQEDVKGVMGRLPESQLTDSPQISRLLSQSYKIGEKLQALALNGGDEMMFSASPTFRKYLESSAGKKLIKKGFSGLQEGLVVPSIVTEISPDKLILSLPMFGENCSVSVALKNIYSGIKEDIQSLGIQINQTLMVRILRIFDCSVIEGACTLELVCDKPTVNEIGEILLEDFMFSQKRIHNFWKNDGHPLGEIEMGSQVEGTVVAVSTIGAVVNMDNGARAVVMPMHIANDLVLEVGLRVKGTVMYIDVVNQCVEITLWKHVHETFSSAAKVLDVGKHKRGTVYISRPDVLVCGVKHFKSSYIVYVPSRWHINDFHPTPFFPVGVIEPLTITECRDGLIFAVPRKVELLVKKLKLNKSDADSAGEDDLGEEIHSSEVKEKVKHKSLEVGFDGIMDFISLNTDICVKNEQKLIENGIASNFQHVKKGEQERNNSFDEFSGVSAEFSQLKENVSEMQGGKSTKAELKKKKKSISLENGISEIEKTDNSNVCINNEKLSNVEIKSKKQKRKAENDDSLSLNESFDASQPLKEYLDHFGIIVNEKEEKKKMKKNNSLEKSVNNSQPEGSVFEMEEHDFKIKETCNESNVHLAVENKSKKQKKNVANNRLNVEESSDLSQCAEEKIQELVKHNNRTEKKKRKNSLEKDINEIQLMEESNVSVEKDSFGNEIEKVDKNLQTSGVNESFNNEDGKGKIKNKKRKRETVVNQSSPVEETTDVPCLVEENLCESVISRNTSKPEIMKKKKKKTEDSLLNCQDEDNLLVCNFNLTKEMKNTNKEKNSSLDNKEYEKKKEEEEEKPSEKCKDKKQPDFLNVSAGFFWNATPDQLPAVNKPKNAEPDSSSEDEAEAEVATNKKKKQRLTMVEKRELARQEEERLRKIEERLMDAERNPVSADDFDRLVMSAPNDSRNWIKYMAYHLEATEVGKARAVAERALKTISFREEQEKLNVWVALLNLENLYGTQESLDKTLEEAVQMNDSQKIHMQVLNMFSTTKKLEELNKMVQLVTKKYKSEVNTWIEAGLACIKCGEIEKSRQLMQRALTVLDKKHHVEILSRFARMENEWGESERAETLMENVLTSYPRRIDVWSVYVDMLIKSKKFDIARQVLDRAVIQKLPVSKMKFLFKKYLAFEQAHGTPDKVEKIREMAKNFVENLKSDVA